MNGDPLHRTTGETLDLPERYRILECLATTHAGAVFRARDLRQGRDIAIKVYLKSLCNAELRASIVRERQALQELHDSHILPLIGAGMTRAGHVYHLFPLVADRGEAGRLPITSEATTRAWVDVLAALRVAHEAGQVHADVNPSNLLETDSGCWLLADWGSCHRPGDPAVADTQCLGTPGYMPPEQMRGMPLTPSSDLFALAMTLIRLHSGEALLRETSINGLAPLFGDVRPAAAGRLTGMPEDIRGLLLLCLHPQPEMRPASAGWAIEKLCTTQHPPTVSEGIER